MQPELINALKIAFCYMPEEHEIVALNYGENTHQVQKDRELVIEVLVASGIDPKSVYAELNPPLN